MAEARVLVLLEGVASRGKRKNHHDSATHFPARMGSGKNREDGSSCATSGLARGVRREQKNSGGTACHLSGAGSWMEMGENEREQQGYFSIGGARRCKGHIC